VNNLLLLNQYPDIEADRKGGRRHFPIAYGVKKSTLVFAVNLLATAVVLIVGALTDWFPLWSLLALLALIPGVIAWRGAEKMGADIGQQPQFMVANVMSNLLTPAVLGLTLILA